MATRISTGRQASAGSDNKMTLRTCSFSWLAVDPELSHETIDDAEKSNSLEERVVKHLLETGRAKWRPVRVHLRKRQRGEWTRAGTHGAKRKLGSE